MNCKLVLYLGLILLLHSCQKETQTRVVATQKDLEKRKVIFVNIDKGWSFNANASNETARTNLSIWKEWKDFMTELAQKPKKTIGAFQKKSSELSKKVTALNNNIPSNFDTPQIKSRIAILITKVKMLDLYIHLKEIPDQKVNQLVPEINTELAALQNQMDKIVQKSKIPLEEGESELLKMLDTTRAIPNAPPAGYPTASPSYPNSQSPYQNRSRLE